MVNLLSELLPIAARAMTLEERLRSGLRLAPTAIVSDAAELIAPWVRAAADDDREVLRRRLSWDGLEESEVVAALGSAVTISRESLPSWTSVLSAALARAPSLAEEFGRGSVPELEQLPADERPRFPEVWIPFLRVARERVAALAGSRYDLLARSAHRALETSLLAQVAWMAELTLYERFAAERNSRVLPGGATNISGGGSRRHYAEFVESLLSGGLLVLLAEFSALGRLIGILVETWVETAAELLERLDADRELLGERLGATGRVVDLGAGLSDRHAGGRTAFFLRFESGAKLVYKPRTLALEAAWNGFLCWLSKRGARPLLPRARVVEHPGYGYVEFLEPAALSSPGEAREYFRQAGGLIAVAWLIGINDLHLDNVIATAQGPVVIDSESALQPEISPLSGVTRGSEEVASRLGAWTSDSVLRSGLLTTPQLDADGRLADIGGLRGTGGHPLSFRRRVFRNPNTDEMELVWEQALAPAMQNLPALEGRRLLPDEFPDAVCEGFSATYRFLFDRREEIAAPGGPLERFAGSKTRLVLRPSDFYAKLLAELSAPGHLRDGVMRSFAIESLNRVFAGQVARPRLWPLVREERRALEQFDIPYFLIGVDSRSLEAPDGEAVVGFVAKSGLEAVRWRLSRMSMDHLEENRSVVAAHLCSDEGGESRRSAQGSAKLSSFWVRLAVEIGDELLRAGISGEDGSLRWSPPSFSARPEDSITALSLYEGTVGTALFLAALERTTGTQRFGNAARAACRPISAALAAPEDALFAPKAHLGASEGLGSLVYGLTLIGTMLADPEPLTLAARAASLVTPERIRGDELFDVQSGLAGAILGLLALAEAVPGTDAIHSAVRCGEHLLSRRRDLGAGRCGWPTPQGRCLAGFAHGVGGIALALSRLAAATGRDDFAEAAASGRRYERELFDPNEGNWAILGRNGRRLFMVAWCHGAPGILLSRLGIRCSVGEQLREDLDCAIAATLRAPILTTDHICCGNGAVIEALLEAGRELERTDLLGQARARTAAVIHRASERGSFRFRMSEMEDASFQPSFFRGLSGLGYTLLRLEDPAGLPSVLRFAPAPPGLFRS